MRSIVVFYLALFLTLGAGCAFAPKARFGPQNEEVEEEVEQVEDFDPLSLDEGGVQTVEEEEQTDPRDQREEERPVTLPDIEEPKDSEQLQGYRVQIFVSSNLESAQRIVAEAETIFPQEVYLQYDAPYYKVRIGNCLTRREGDLLQENAIRRGYRDAWVVRSLVYPPQE
jgi:hypothetical protein